MWPKIDRGLRPHLPENHPAADSLRQKMSMAGIPADGRLIGVAPGARWESKRWPAKFFAELIGELHRRKPGLNFVLLGAGDCREDAAEIIKLSGGFRVFSLVGETGICELVEAVRRCFLLVCNDSGPMHIAAALGVPACAFFGPTDPAKTGPFGDFHYIFQRTLNCGKCLQRKCPDGTLKCHELEIAGIVDTLYQYLEGKKE